MQYATSGIYIEGDMVTDVITNSLAFDDSALRVPINQARRAKSSEATLHPIFG